MASRNLFFLMQESYPRALGNRSIQVPYLLQPQQMQWALGIPKVLKGKGFFASKVGAGSGWEAK